MTVYVVTERKTAVVVAAYSSYEEACHHAEHLADEKEAELQELIMHGADFEMDRKGNTVAAFDSYDSRFDEVYDYTVYTMEVLDKFED